MAFICSSCQIQTWRVSWYLFIKGESNFLPCSSAVSLTYCCEQEEHNCLPQGPQSQPCLPSQARQYFLLSNRIIETRLVRGLLIIWKVVQKHANRGKKDWRWTFLISSNIWRIVEWKTLYLSCQHQRAGCCACTVATPWTAARQPPLSTGFSRKESWSGVPFPPPGDLLAPGIEPTSFASLALSGGFFTTAPPGKLGLSPEGGKRPTVAAVLKEKELFGKELRLVLYLVEKQSRNITIGKKLLILDTC